MAHSNRRSSGTIQLRDIINPLISLFPEDSSLLMTSSRFFAHDRSILTPFSTGPYGSRLIIGAVRGGSSTLRLLELLRYQTHANFNGLGGTYASALIWAVRAQRTDLLRALLQQPGIDSDALNHDGITAFSAACDHYKSAADPAARSKAAACAHALSASPRCSPAGNATGTNHLSLACHARLPDIVQAWVRDARCTADVVAQLDGSGKSAFAAACYLAQDSARDLSTEERQAAAACARAIAASPHCSPADSNGNNTTNLSWACCASLADVVQTWLLDARCTADVVAQLDGSGKSAFAAACYLAQDSARDLSTEERQAAAACARAIAASPHCSPAGMDSNNITNLSWACCAGLVDVVQTWLLDARCTADVVAQLNVNNDSAFGCACYYAQDSDRDLSAEERQAVAACARAIATSTHCSPADMDGTNATNLSWACCAGLADVVQTWLLDARCTADVVAQVNSHGESAFARSCIIVEDDGRIYSVKERQTVAACARALASSPHCSPAAVNKKNKCTNLHWASAACLLDVVQAWLVDPRCTASVRASKIRAFPYETALTIARNATADMSRTLAERIAAEACVTALTLM